MSSTGFCGAFGKPDSRQLHAWRVAQLVINKKGAFSGVFTGGERGHAKNKQALHHFDLGHESAN
jgi:hypothetical protein